jgi:hypothetical protein
MGKKEIRVRVFDHGGYYHDEKSRGAYFAPRQRHCKTVPRCEAMDAVMACHYLGDATKESICSFLEQIILDAKHISVEWGGCTVDGVYLKYPE